jgi:microcystin-dependent protein
MSTTYMNLTLPVPSVSPGPAWATTVNTAIETVDSHDHTSGKGTPVPVAGLDIDANLDIQEHKLLNVKSVNLESQASVMVASNVQAIYSVAGDLYYNNSSGTPVQLTSGSSITSASSPLTPPGIILPYGGSSAPTGYLLCDGTAVSRATYASLFAIIGTVYGVGDGATTFNVPNANGRTAVGAGTYTDTVSGSITRTLGASAGAEKHVIVTAEMASHNHGGGSHTHTTIADVSVGSVTAPTASNYIARALSGGSANDYSLSGTATGATVGLTSASGATISSNGSDTAHNNMQPYFVTNYIIKT